MNKLLIAVGGIFLSLILYAVFFRIPSADEITSIDAKVQKTLSDANSTQAATIDSKWETQRRFIQDNSDTTSMKIKRLQSSVNDITRIVRNLPKNNIDNKRYEYLLKRINHLDSIVMEGNKNGDTAKILLKKAVN